MTVKGLNELSEDAARTAKAHGFDDASVGEEIALQHSELSEALEDYRKGHSPTAKWWEEKVQAFTSDGSAIIDAGKPVYVAIKHFVPRSLEGKLYKPCGIPSEIADVIIRALHFSGKYGINIEEEVAEKMAYNETREFKHGKKL